MDGASIADKILMKLESYGFDPNLLRCQSYDGSGNMAGKNRGASAIITAKYPKALFVHCNSHVLNLAIVKACSLSPIRNMMGILEEISIFFEYSPKRTNLLQSMINDKTPEAGRKKLVNLCKTRWVARHDALEVFGQLYFSVVATMDHIKAESAAWSSETVNKANYLLHAIQQFDFLLSYVTCRNGLRLIFSLSAALQGRAMDTFRAIQEIRTVIQSIRLVRDQLDTKGEQWYEEALQMSQSVDGPEPKVPRTTSRQLQRDNVPYTTPEEYYRRSIIVPFVDHLFSEMNNRFNEGRNNYSEGLVLIPAILKSEPDWKRLALKFAETFTDDLPHASTLSEELDLWQVKWAEVKNRCSSLAETLLATSKAIFPNLHSLFHLLVTVPVTSCECERSFSRLRCLKTYLRSTMGQERLSSLALLSIHRDIDIDVQEVVSEFARAHPRRMKLQMM